MNWHAVRAIYRFEMARTFRTLVQSILTPVLTTSLYFVVFGSAIGSRMTEIGGVPFARVHRARPHHAVGAQREHRQCLLRHLFPEMVRHHLRAALGAGVDARRSCWATWARRPPSR